MQSQPTGKKIDKYCQLYSEFSKTDEYAKENADRLNRIEHFSNVFKKRNLESMTEFDFGELIAKLWSFRSWNNKEYLVRSIIEANQGLESLKQNLIDLLHGEDSIEKRYERFAKNVRSFGPASTTEVLSHFKPEDYGIWNDRARKGLKALGYEGILPIGKYRISGQEYLKLNEIERELMKELNNRGLKIPNLLAVDYFLWRVWYISEQEAEKFEDSIEPKYEFDHDETRDHIREIGHNLGFEAEIESTIQHGARVDVIWSAKIANLGVVKYVFEVQKTGSIDSLILNLQKAKKNPSVQKLIAVSDTVQIEKIRKELIGLSDDFVRYVSFWDAKDVRTTYEKISDVILEINKLQLVKSEFE